MITEAFALQIMASDIFNPLNFRTLDLNLLRVFDEVMTVTSKGVSVTGQPDSTSVLVYDKQ